MEEQMTTKINKAELAGALTALGKLVCRMSPIPAYRAVQIEGNNNMLFFRTHNADEEIEFQMETETAETFKVAVDFDFFRSLVKNCRNKNITLDFKDGKLLFDDVPIVPIETEWTALDIPQGDNATISFLPDNFVDVLNNAAPQAYTDTPRTILNGINLSADGITASNKKELFNYPYRFNLDELTIPFPLALMATKATGDGSITAWNTDLFVMFSIRIGKWRWTAKALSGAYPNWKRIMPDSNALKHCVCFTVDSAEQLKFFLKSVTDRKPSNEIRICRDAVGFLTLRDGDGHVFSIPAEFDSTWGSFTVVIKKDILLHLLNKRHTEISFSDGMRPFIGTGGVGRYVAMPMREQKTEQQEQIATTMQNDPSVSSGSKESVTEKTPLPCHENPAKPNTTQNKETQAMNESPNITHVVSAPVQTCTPKPKPETKMSPIDELTAIVEAFKAKLKDVFDESAALSRKVREVAISVKQTERDALAAKRKVDRIRLAI